MTDARALPPSLPADLAFNPTAQPGVPGEWERREAHGYPVAGGGRLEVGVYRSVARPSLILCRAVLSLPNTPSADPLAASGVGFLVDLEPLLEALATERAGELLGRAITRAAAAGASLQASRDLAAAVAAVLAGLATPGAAP